MVSLRRHCKQHQQPDPLRQVRGATAELGKRLSEVNSRLDDFAEALSQVAATARTAEEAARRAAGDE